MTIVDLLSPQAEVVVTRRREDPELAARGDCLHQ
jgi:hypothetical protein